VLALRLGFLLPAGAEVAESEIRSGIVGGVSGVMGESEEVEEAKLSMGDEGDMAIEDDKARE